MELDLAKYKGKRVLITGHTGFKGSWLSMLLVQLGAQVYGYATNPPTNPSMFELCKLESKMNSFLGDVRDLAHLEEVFDEVKPEIVFHLAAQPIVRESYRNPVETYEVNVLGTVNVLECIRKTGGIQSVIIVTTDKVYENVGKREGYVETDSLNGYDPYSNSKSCAELVTNSYVNSFLREKGIPVSTLRAGNVIGGGDFAQERLLPDCVRALEQKSIVTLRNPLATRPFQHVLEPLSVYLLLALQQMEQPEIAGAYNVGPEETAISVEDMVRTFAESWERKNSMQISQGEMPEFHWEVCKDTETFHEAAILQLNSNKVNRLLMRKPKWNAKDAIELVTEWTTAYLSHKDLAAETEREIRKYLS